MRLVYSTKHREPWIDEDHRSSLFAYQAGIFIAWESPTLVIGGVEDHVHALFSLSKNHPLKKVVAEVTRYIERQKEHHRRVNFQDEVRALFKPCLSGLLTKERRASLGKWGTPGFQAEQCSVLRRRTAFVSKPDKHSSNGMKSNSTNAMSGLEANETSRSSAAKGSNHRAGRYSALSGLDDLWVTVPQGVALGWFVDAPSGRRDDDEGIHSFSSKPVGSTWQCRITAAACSFVLFCSAFSSYAIEAPLADAAEKSDRAAIRALLKQRADVNAPQADGMTALHWAVHRDDLETAKLLASANANVTNRYGVTPLSLACQNGNTAMVELLLERGGDPNTTLRGGETVLMTAARTGKPGPVKALLARGSKVDAKERRGQTALMWAAADGHAAVVELLLKAGADFRTPLPDSGFTPLFFAAREGRTDVVRVLLKAGADVNEVMPPRNPSGKGPVSGTSALVLAIENGHYELALALLDAGADPNDQRSGFTPLHMLSWVRKPPKGEDYGAPPPAELGKLNSLLFVKELVKRGADVNGRLANGQSGPGQFSRKSATPFLLASATADVAYMKLLLELGSNPSVANADNTTPLLVACGIHVGSDAANEVAGDEAEVLAAALLLLKLGADVNAVDANGDTAMHAAALKNLPKVVQLLADKGAKVEIWNRKNKYGWTPLSIAEGHRPGNFKPSAETIVAVQKVMLAAGVTPPVNVPPVVKVEKYQP